MSSNCLHLIAGHILSIPPPSFLHNRPTAHCAESEDGGAGGSQQVAKKHISITGRGGLSRVWQDLGTRKASWRGGGAQKDEERGLGIERCAFQSAVVTRLTSLPSVGG